MVVISANTRWNKQFPVALEAAWAALEVNQVSDPVVVEFGVHFGEIDREYCSK